MKTENIDQISSLRRSSNTLRTMKTKYSKLISDPRCDKHELCFGGDSSFVIFKTSVNLCGLTGYYGSSSCSTLTNVDNAHAQEFLIQALNKNMDLILADMAEFAAKKASALLSDAQKEVDRLQTMLDEVVAITSQSGVA